MNDAQPPKTYEEKPMTPPETVPSAEGDANAAAVARYAITRVPVDYFHVGPFRYTALSDAIAEGKRRSVGT